METYRMTQEEQNPITWTVPDFSKHVTHEHTNTTYRRINIGQIKAVKVGNRNLIPDSERIRVEKEGLQSIPEYLAAVAA